MIGAILICISLVAVAVPLGAVLWLAVACAPGRRVSIVTEGYSLRATVYGEPTPRDPRPGLLFLAGWSPSRFAWRPSDAHARVCAKRLGCVCMTVALRGMGSPGDIARLTRADLLEDAAAAYDFLAALDGVDRERVSVVGESFGAYLACVLSAQRPVRALALRVPTDFPNAGFADVPQERFAGVLSLGWKRQEHSPSESRALDAVHHFFGDILVVASELDTIVPLQTTQNYLSSAPDPGRLTFRMMRGAGHGLTSPLGQIAFVRRLLEWLGEHAK